uniref:Uncharacterized protein n=1 Tax=viral metagenome TaxID=1070528 RepID=A0A6M3XX55_9ZZZZ
MSEQKELELRKRFWITKKQLNNLFLLEHKKSRETLINEIIKKQSLNEINWVLSYCSNCIQVTNHSGGKCLKCGKK